MAHISVRPPTSQAPQVETVCAENGETLPRKRFATREIIVIVEGCISLDREDCAEEQLHVATETVEIPAGVERGITAHETPTHLVLIHPQPSAPD